MQGSTVFQREGVIAYRNMSLTSGQPPTVTASVPLSLLALRVQFRYSKSQETGHQQAD